MGIYNLPKFNLGRIKIFFKNPKNRMFFGAVSLIIAGSIIGFFGFFVGLNYFPAQTQGLMQYFNIPGLIAPELQALKTNTQTCESEYTPSISYEQAIIDAVKSSSPSVVSIVISKNLPVYEQEWISPFGDLAPEFQIPQYVQKGSKLQEVGAGTGFIVTADGLVLTNKHVVLDSQAEYTVFASDGQKYPAKVLALDPVQDLAVAKIQSDEVFQPAKLGDSSAIQIGQTVIAIGNALGQFSNTVSVGVVSGLQRIISASDRSGSFSETLQGIIQTDAAINSGNSGGPLLNLKGEVIGINTAMAEGAQNIGFAIPINMAKRDIDQVVKTNKIVYPFLGVRYVIIDAGVKEKYNLSVDYGVLVLKGASGEPAVTVGSAAQNAGIKEGDILLELNGKKITTKNSLANMIIEHNPGDTITLKILRDEQEQNIDVTLGERPS